MNRFIETLVGEPAEREKRRSFTVKAIYVTAAVLVLLLITLAISGIASAIGSDDSKDGKDDGLSYVGLTVSKSDLRSGDLILVNKNNPISFEDNSELVAFSTGKGYGLKDNTLRAAPEALSAFDAMINDLIANVAECDVVVMTAHRTKEYQDSLGNGTPGGCSDFHTGMSFELKDGETYSKGYDRLNDGTKYNWVYENAHKYGFIVRYPDDTDEKSYSLLTGVDDYAYVFRYVGVPHATYIYENGLCLEEYLELLRTSHKKGNSLKIKGGDSLSYEVYYCEAEGDSSEIQVPTKYQYEVSGDNMNGYIVTVCRSKAVK